MELRKEFKTELENLESNCYRLIEAAESTDSISMREVYYDRFYATQQKLFECVDKEMHLAGGERDAINMALEKKLNIVLLLKYRISDQDILNLNFKKCQDKYKLGDIVLTPSDNRIYWLDCTYFNRFYDLDSLREYIATTLNATIKNLEASIARDSEKLNESRTIYNSIFNDSKRA